MALFLSENIDTFGYSDMTMEEAFAGLLDVESEFAELNESIMHADFIMHQNHSAGYLSEAQAANEESNFLMRIITKLKELIIKAKNAVVGFFGRIKEALAAFWRKLTAKKEVTVRQRASGFINDLIGKFNAYRESTLAEYDNPGIAKRTIAAAEAALKTAFDATKNAISSSTDFVSVNIGSMSNAQKFILAAGTIGAGLGAWYTAKNNGIEKAKSWLGKLNDKRKAMVDKVKNYLSTVKTTINFTNRVSGWYAKVSEMVKKWVVSKLSKDEQQGQGQQQQAAQHIEPVTGNA